MSDSKPDWYYVYLSARCQHKYFAQQDHINIKVYQLSAATTIHPLLQVYARQKISRAGNHCKMQRFYVAQEFNPAQTLEKKEYGSIMYVFISPFFSRIKVKSRLRR